MKSSLKRLTLSLACLSLAWMCSAEASAQVPVQTTSTPTVHGGTPMNGTALVGEVGYAALRGGFYTGSAKQDFGLELSAPTFGNDTLPGWGQSLGIDVRAPFRFLLANWARANGSFKIGPYFHAGRACYGRYRHYRDLPGPGPNVVVVDDGGHSCGFRTVGVGLNLGFVTDIALPKLFKIVVGIEQQLGLLNARNRDIDAHSNNFAGATWIDLGLEAFWRNMFFLTIINAGAQYGSNDLYYRNHALFRQMFGFGYKFN
ncbi:MAG: hypothetical protein QM778_16760 [Myxococcales bacterium]